MGKGNSGLAERAWLTGGIRRESVMEGVGESEVRGDRKPDIEAL